MSDSLRLWTLAPITSLRSWQSLWSFFTLKTSLSDTLMDLQISARRHGAWRRTATFGHFTWAMVTATSALGGSQIIVLLRTPSPLGERVQHEDTVHTHVTLYILSRDRGVAYMYIPVLITRTIIVGAGLPYPKGNFLLAKKASLWKEFTPHCKEATEHSTSARRRF